MLCDDCLQTKTEHPNTEKQEPICSDCQPKWCKVDKAQMRCRYGNECRTKHCKYKHGDSRDKGRGAKGEGVGGAKPARKGKGGEGKGACSDDEKIKALEKKIRDLKADIGDADVSFTAALRMSLICCVRC